MGKMFTEDFEQYMGYFIRVNRTNQDDYVGVATDYRNHDDTSLPGADIISFFESNTGRTTHIYRAEITGISVICKD